MDKHLLSLLVCPICKKDLKLDKTRKELICCFDSLAYSLKDGIPVMLPEKARQLSLEEVEAYRQQ